MEFTLTLLAIAIILFLAVLLLELSKPQKQKNLQQEPEVRVYYNKELASEEKLPTDYNITEQLIKLQAKYNGLNKKTEMAHERLNDLEQEIIASKNSDLNSSKLSTIEEKIEKFNDFCTNTEIELQALKKILASEIHAKQKPTQNSFDKQKQLNEKCAYNIVSTRKR